MDGIFIGIVSGVMASLCFSVFLFLIRPKIRLSEQICKDPGSPESKTYVYRIKVVNLTPAMLTKLKYSFQYCEEHPDGITSSTAILARCPPLLSIDKYKNKKNYTDYAVRISYEIDPLRLPVIDDVYFRFTFIACHSYSNTSLTVKKKYKSTDEILEGHFETGKSTKILTTRH